MAPELTQFNDMSYVSEAFDIETKTFQFTTFALIEKDDEAYSGRLAIPKLKIPLADYSAALARIPDAEIYPTFPHGEEKLTTFEYDHPLPSGLYVKRPRMWEYEDYKGKAFLEVLPDLLLEEARNLEVLRRHPHPGIVTYHGCRVRRGFITGLVLDNHPRNLRDYVNNQVQPPLDRTTFMGALGSALAHLHSLGLAHNDLNPANVLVSDTGMPVLIDFESCRPVGQKLLHTRGTPGWTDENDSWDTSEIRHDAYAIEKIRTWLDDKVVDLMPYLKMTSGSKWQVVEIVLQSHMGNLEGVVVNIDLRYTHRGEYGTIGHALPGDEFLLPGQ